MLMQNWAIFIRRMGLNYLLSANKPSLMRHHLISKNKWQP